MLEQDGEDEDCIECLVAAVERGEAGALNRLIAPIYPKPKRLAHYQLLQDRPGHFLNTTAIVHAAYVRLVSGDGSPEQRAGKPVTTASDFYQCGLVLNEMLTGQQPITSRPDNTMPLVLSRFRQGRSGFRAVPGEFDTIFPTLRTRIRRRAAKARDFLFDVLAVADLFQPANSARGKDITVVEAWLSKFERNRDDIVRSPQPIEGGIKKMRRHSSEKISEPIIAVGSLLAINGTSRKEEV